MHRRKFLIACLLLIGALGLGIAAYPFVSSLSPSKARPLVIDIDMAEFPDGGSKVLGFRGRPIVFRKTDSEMKEYLVSLNDVANGPDYTVDDVPDFFIHEMISTAGGCLLRDTGAEGHEYYEITGFWDPCRSGFWDYAGRLLPGVHGGRGLPDLTPVLSYQLVGEATVRVFE